MGITKKIALAFLGFVNILFLIFENGDQQKNAPGFLGFVSILFLVFENGNKQKNCTRFFRSCKYTLFNI